MRRALTIVPPLAARRVGPLTEVSRSGANDPGAAVLPGTAECVAREGPGSARGRRAVRYSPWEDLGQRHIALEFTPLPPHEAGLWMPERNTIIIDPRLTQTQKRCALAHELVHQERGHVWTCDRRLAVMQEEEADRVAALRLVTLDALADALLWTLDHAELAETLWVTPRMLRCRMRILRDRDWRAIDEWIDDAERRLGPDFGEREVRWHIRASTLNPTVPVFEWPADPDMPDGRMVERFEESA